MEMEVLVFNRECTICYQKSFHKIIIEIGDQNFVSYFANKETSDIRIRSCIRRIAYISFRNATKTHVHAGGFVKKEPCKIMHTKEYNAYEPSACTQLSSKV